MDEHGLDSAIYWLCKILQCNAFLELDMILNNFVHQHIVIQTSVFSLMRPGSKKAELLW